MTNGGQAMIGGDLDFYPTPSTLVGGGGYGYFDGAGTVVTVTGDVNAIPEAGATRGGSVQVSDGALLHAGALFADSGGANLNIIAVSSAATVQLDSAFVVGDQLTANMTVQGSSTVTLASGAMAVGFLSGGNGTLTIDASTLTVGGAAISIGRNSGATGLISLTNPR